MDCEKEIFKASNLKISNIYSPDLVDIMFLQTFFKEHLLDLNTVALCFTPNFYVYCIKISQSKHKI